MDMIGKDTDSGCGAPERSRDSGDATMTAIGALLASAIVLADEASEFLIGAHIATAQDILAVRRGATWAEGPWPSELRPGQ